MAIAFTNVDGGTTGPTSTLTIDAATYATTTLVLLTVVTIDLQLSPGDGTTPSGLNTTNWVKVATQTLDTSRRHTVWSAVGTGVNSTISLPLTSQEDCAISIETVTGGDLTRGLLGNGIEQVATKLGTIPSGTAIPTTALASLQTSSATFLSVAGNDGFTGTIDPPAGWTELGDFISTSGNKIITETSYLVAGATNPSAAINGSTGTPTYSTFIIEILSPASASTTSWRPNTTWFTAT